MWKKENTHLLLLSPCNFDHVPGQGLIVWQLDVGNINQFGEFSLVRGGDTVSESDVVKLSMTMSEAIRCCGTRSLQFLHYNRCFMD